MKNDIKQVIIIRKDLKMKKGKIASQASHACMGVFFDKLQKTKNGWNLPKTPFFDEFIHGSFKKIVVGVDTESELLDIFQKAKNLKIHASLIMDSGKTVFNGIPTHTAVCLGPWETTELDKLTGHLKLL